MPYNLKRLAGYLLGFVLFYAPFALFQRALGYLLMHTNYVQTIHSLCLRIPIEHILDGNIFRYTPVSVVSTIMLLLAAFCFGPVFCGRLCPAGALTELLSRPVPDRFKISWRSYTEIAPIRYGMLAGFCLVPFVDGILACTYCNFFLFDLLVNYATRGYFISLTSSLILTAFLWLVVLACSRRAVAASAISSVLSARRRALCMRLAAGWGFPGRCRWISKSASAAASVPRPALWRRRRCRRSRCSCASITVLSAACVRIAALCRL